MASGGSPPKPWERGTSSASSSAWEQPRLTNTTRDTSNAPPQSVAPGPGRPGPRPWERGVPSPHPRHPMEPWEASPPPSYLWGDREGVGGYYGDGYGGTYAPYTSGYHGYRDPYAWKWGSPPGAPRGGFLESVFYIVQTFGRFSDLLRDSYDATHTLFSSISRFMHRASNMTDELHFLSRPRTLGVLLFLLSLLAGWLLANLNRDRRALEMDGRRMQDAWREGM